MQTVSKAHKGVVREAVLDILGKENLTFNELIDVLSAVWITTLVFQVRGDLDDLRHSLVESFDDFCRNGEWMLAEANGGTVHQKIPNA